MKSLIGRFLCPLVCHFHERNTYCSGEWRRILIPMILQVEEAVVSWVENVT